MKVNSYKKIDIKSPEPLITFSTTGGGSWKEWDRFIELANEKAFHIGNVCGTCNFFFKKLGGAVNRSNSKRLVEVLKADESIIGDNAIGELSQLFESGDYLVVNATVKPKHVVPFGDDDYFSHEIIDIYGITEFSGLPFFPDTTYYRCEDETIDNETRRFTFIVPMIPDSWLDEETINYYSGKIAADEKPTCVALSVIDDKQASDWPDDVDHTRHLCIANYLIDGHHKLFAAAKLGKEINILSFINLNRGVSSHENVLKALGIPA